MTPEQLAHIRQWAEWGESPTPETTIALLDHIAWWEGQFKRVQHGLTAHSNKLWAIRKLHRKVTRYGDDEYSIPADEYLETPDEHPGLEPFDVCTHCMDIETTVQGDDVHWIGIESAWPCPTIQALDGD